MKVQKYFMRTRMHGTPTGRPDYQSSYIPTANSELLRFRLLHHIKGASHANRRVSLMSLSARLRL